MYPAKAPGITVEIERRIRRGLYTGRLPDNGSLQNEFKVARQTMTEALRPLVGRGILRCRSLRTGLEIDTSALVTGRVLIVSGVLSADTERLQREIRLDGFTPVYCAGLTFQDFRCALAELQPIGVLFMNSALTVEMANLLQKKGIPFVSCNQLPILSPAVNSIDYDLERDMRWLLEPLMKAGYRHITYFFSGRMEGYNELALKTFCKVKRSLGLPVDKCDRVLSAWNRPLRENLEGKLSAICRCKPFPEVMLSIADLREEMARIREKGRFPLPPDFWVLCESNRQKRHSQQGNCRCYHSMFAQWRLWGYGYDFLREVILGLHERPVQRLLVRPHALDCEIPPCPPRR
ncbi:MAG: GntR family transcriptional regulator [Victivallales bacterium]|nr:GntR family transcriptional regulator [Victivallales bacterium]